MGVIKILHNKFNLVVIGATLTTCLLCYNMYRPNAYEISVNGKTVAYVVDKDKAEKINKDIIDDVNKRFGNLNIDDKVTVQKINALNSALSSEESIKKNILNVLDIEVDAVEMNVDGKTIGILANESEGAKVIELIGNYYLSESNLKNKKVIGARNKVTYLQKKVHISNLNSPENLSKEIIEDIKSKKSNLNIETCGSSEEKASVSFATIINYSNALQRGQSQLKSKGVDGSKIVEKKITMVNGIKVGEAVIKESVIEKSKDAIIIKGTKDSNSSTASSNTSVMAVPSRGSITSAFGERWGKMHEGIDIAGSTGDPIYAAMDGKVVFAGVESGYGNVIKLSHNGNIETIYGHCSSILVKAGQIIKRGQVIGKVGSTGKSTGPHLHFEVRLNGKPQNPTKYIYNKAQS